jgi:hypothetical protein
MSAIEKINQGLPPPSIDLVPGRVGTATSSMGSNSLHVDDFNMNSVAMVSTRT